MPGGGYRMRRPLRRTCCWAAHAVGLGGCLDGRVFLEDRVRAVRNVLGLPRRVVPLNVIPIGYPAENPALKQKWDPAKVRCNGWAE